MRATAKLGGKLADGHHAHTVLVLLAKQRQGPALERVFHGHDLGRCLLVLEDPMVDQILDLAQLGLG